MTSLNSNNIQRENWLQLKKKIAPITSSCRLSGLLFTGKRKDGKEVCVKASSLDMERQYLSNAGKQ